jgi:hypothetical protein
LGLLVLEFPNDVNPHLPDATPNKKKDIISSGEIMVSKPNNKRKVSPYIN